MARLESVHPVLMCRDVAASVGFFERLGFVAIFQDDSKAPRYAALERDSVQIHLQWADASQWAHPVDRPAYRFVVSDVDALYGDFESRQALDRPSDETRSPWHRPGDTPWGTREFHLRDPDGNGLHFYRAL